MIGIDEVGRGAWAGPLVVAGCYFTENPGFLHGLDDSKKLSRKQRELIESSIKSSTCFKIVSVEPTYIDRHGLTASIKKAVLEILDDMPADMTIMLDGKYNFLAGTKYAIRTLVEVGADRHYAAVMAASNLAKVERDRIMQAYDKRYIGYGFARNVGYGTREHAAAICSLGLTPIHRISFKPVGVHV